MASSFPGDPWTRRPVPGATSLRPALVRTRVDGLVDGPIPCLPDAPQLARGGDGMPLLALTLLLERQPRSDEPDLAPLLRLGVYSLTLTLGLPAGALVAAAGPGEVLAPPFVSEARFRIDGGTDTLGEAGGTGIGATAVLGGSLQPAATLAMLAAIDGRRSGLLARATVSVRGPTRPEKVHLSGWWQEVYDALTERADADGLITHDALRAGFEELVSTGVVTVELSESLGDGAGGDAGFSAFAQASTWILRGEDPDALRLGARPPATMQLDVRLSVEAGLVEHVELEAPLESVLGGCLDGLDRDRFIRLVAADPQTAEIRPTPPITGGSSAARDVGGLDGSLPMQVSGGVIRSLQLALVPDRSAIPGAAAILASDVRASRIGVDRFQTVLATDIVLPVDDPDRPQPLPVVDDPSAVLWHDRIDPSAYWYAPSFVFLPPSPSDDPNAASFRFSFERSGVTAGADPEPGLDGSVAFRLTRTVPDPVAAAIAAAGGPRATPVPTSNLSISLEIPFRDSTGQTQVQAFPATLEEQGDSVTATVELLDDWVRLCYGSLAYEGFQATPPRLRVSYAYRIYSPVDDEPLHLAFGGKVQLLAAYPLVTATRGVVRDVALTAFHVLPAATLGIAATAAQPTVPLTVLHPELIVSPVLVGAAAEQPTYATRTAVHDEAADVVVACDELGAFYMTEQDGISVSVGCQDALKLGQIAYKQYEELHDLAGDRYRVFRSLQQPGRFLLLPRSYRITRYAATEPSDRAFRPVILLYATFDGTKGGSYFLSATLQADVAPSERLELLDRLASRTPFGKEPTIHLPTDPAVQATTTFNWGVPSAVSRPDVQQVWDAFQVTVSAGISEALTLTNLIEHGGLNGNVSFELLDGQSLSSELTLDTSVIGPWTTGPLEIVTTATDVALTDRIERAVDVFDLVIRGASGSVRRIPADVTLQPGATAHVQATVLADDAVAASYATASGPLTLEQLDVFVEDVTATVTILNLVDFGTHDLASLLVHVRRRGDQHVDDAELPEGGSVTVEIVFPLPSYLSDRWIEIQIEKRTSGGEISTTEWMPYDLSEGVVVSIEWSLIA